MTDSLKQRLNDDVKAAMRAKDKPRLGTLRLVTSAIKQREVDERIDIDDEQLLLILDKMVKQRRESIAQYTQAERHDLVEQEQFEVNILQEYLPAQLSEEEIAEIIKETIDATGASSIKDMGKVMGMIKPKMQGRADMGQVSGLIKAALG